MRSCTLDIDLRLGAIARDALLDHLSRGDPRHALRLLVGALGDALGAPCGLVAHDAVGRTGDAPRRWQCGSVDGAARQVLPLQRLGRVLGTLHLPAGTDPQALRALLPTAAALLLRDHDTSSADSAGLPGPSEHGALVQAALAGADTFVWEWDIASDWLSDIDEGLRLLGYPEGSVRQTQEAWNGLIHPDDLAANHAAYLQHARGETEIYESTYRARAADGQWRWLLERGRIVERDPDGTPRRMLGTQSDITERRRLATAARETTERLTHITEHVPGILLQFRLPPDGSAANFPYISARSQALFGVAPEELLGDARALLNLVDDADRQRVINSVLASARDGTRWRLDFRIHRRDGALRWMRADASPQRQADGSTVWHGYIEDATERRELEHAREQAAVAAAANRAKTEFLSRISHELRTPLNAVLGFTQLMEIDEAEPPGPGQQRRLKLVREAGAHLLQMIGDLLDLTRIESGGMALQLEAVPLRTVVDEALAMLQGSAEKLQITLVLHADEAPLPARVDRTRLRQVLLNLVSNAIKYNRAGGRVEVRLERVDADTVRCSVHDTGVGIAEAELPRVFDPFYRGLQAGTAIEGTGIGLSVTQALVALMGGRITVRSTVGVGSVFTLTLPAAPG
ncbi:PAS domain-containing protein [Rubrivivax sp. RP6-9]|uniref:PAS domain-containing protein n=1 Tax=Rubrivivax sp. RP6-9 TaxID=3415750 RepID=UPI003CC6CC3C